MGFSDFIKGQLIDVIEFTTDDKNILAHKFDDGGKQIMMGAQLTVRPGQMVVFINEGQIADVFTEDRYELSTSNMPLLTKLKSWKYGFESPFKVDIYFISVDDKISQRWGTPSKIAVKDPDFGVIRIGSNGIYNYRVSEPETFIRTLVGTDREYTVNECRAQLNGQFTTSFTDFFGESKKTLFDAYGNLVEFSEDVFKSVKPEFERFGLELISFKVLEISIPKVVEEAMDKRASIGAVSMDDGMNLYERKTLTDATAEAAVKMAEREGSNTGISGFGMEMATGMAMGNIVGNTLGRQTGMMNQGAAGQAAQQSQSSQPMQANQPVQQAQPMQAMQQAQLVMATCSQCQGQSPMGTKFCPHCGNNMALTSSATANTCINCHAPLEEGAKFCSECGTKQEVKPVFCSNCGTKQAVGSKFCPNCGQQQ